MSFFSNCSANLVPGNETTDMDISSNALSTDHHMRLTNIIDHLRVAQKRAETCGNSAAVSFVNEQLKRYTYLHINI